jgi:hypothetical protein
LLFGAFHAGLLGIALATPLLLISLVFGVLLVRRGNSLNRAGRQVEQTTREQALLALMGHRGAVTAQDAAHALGVPGAEADELLTELAKREPERVAVDVDDEGVVHYRLMRVAGEVRVRIEDAAPFGSAEFAPGEVAEGEEEVEGAKKEADP